MLAIFISAVARTLSWVAGQPTGERATALSVTAGLGAGAAAILLAVLALFTGPTVLVLIPLLTAAGIAAWWLLTT